MKFLQQGSSRVLAFAFALSVLCFLISAGGSAFIAFAIGGSAEEIATNFAPSLEHLASVRSELRRLESAVVIGRAPGVPLDRRAIEIGRQVQLVDTEVFSYTHDPNYPGEQVIRDAASGQWQVVKHQVHALMALESEEAAEDVLRMEVEKIRRLVDDLDRILLQGVRLNTSNGDRAAKRIVQTWRQLFFVGALLTIVSVALTVGAAGLAIRTIRQQTRQLEAQADESMQFAGRVAHDILSPLSTIKLFQSFAKASVRNIEGFDEVRGHAESATGRIVQTVNALLEFARAGARPVAGESCDPAVVISGVVDDLRPFAVEKDVRLEFSPSEPVEVQCAPGVLGSVSSNLIRNAIKYMGESRSRHVHVLCSSEPGKFRLEVADTGPGIPPESHQRIFEPLTRLDTRPGESIGLGLATVRRLVEAHQGEVRVESTLGAGSRFIVTLPRKA